MGIPVTDVVTLADGFDTDDATTVGFVDRLRAQSGPYVVEVGTRRADESTPTHHADWLPADGTLIMSDAFPGLDVDVVADAETMTPFESDVYDAVVCCFTLEHIPRPWRAIEAFARILRPGGELYVATHQTFPVHGYPSDYFRFTTEALALLGEDAGLIVESTDYTFPCAIQPEIDLARWNSAAPSWLIVSARYRKTSP